MEYIEVTGLPQWVKEVTVNYGDDVEFSREGNEIIVWYEDQGCVATFEFGANVGSVRNPLA